MGDVSEPRDGRRVLSKADGCGEDPDWRKLGTAVRDRRGWCAWYGNEPSRLLGEGEGGGKGDR
jgi:hypothetical protein